MKPVKAIRTQPKRYNSQILLRLNNFRLNSPFQSFFCQSHSRIPNGILNPVRFHIPNGTSFPDHSHIANGTSFPDHSRIPNGISIQAHSHIANGTSFPDHSRIPNGILNPVRFHIPNGILNHVHFHIPNGIWYFRVRISLNVFPFQLLSVLNS